VQLFPTTFFNPDEKINSSGIVTCSKQSLPWMHVAHSSAKTALIIVMSKIITPAIEPFASSLKQKVFN
jgi:hypothetical protein